MRAQFKKQMFIHWDLSLFTTPFRERHVPHLNALTKFGNIDELKIKT